MKTEPVGIGPEAFVLHIEEGASVERVLLDRRQVDDLTGLPRNTQSCMRDGTIYTVYTHVLDNDDCTTDLGLKIALARAKLTVRHKHLAHPLLLGAVGVLPTDAKRQIVLNLMTGQLKNEYGRGEGVQQEEERYIEQVRE